MCAKYERHGNESHSPNALVSLVWSGGEIIFVAVPSEEEPTQNVSRPFTWKPTHIRQPRPNLAVTVLHVPHIRQAQPNLDVTILYVACSLDSGRALPLSSPQRGSPSSLSSSCRPGQLVAQIRQLWHKFYRQTLIIYKKSLGRFRRFQGKAFEEKWKLYFWERIFLATLKVFAWICSQILGPISKRVILEGRQMTFLRELLHKIFGNFFESESF